MSVIVEFKNDKSVANLIALFVSRMHRNYSICTLYLTDYSYRWR